MNPIDLEGVGKRYRRAPEGHARLSDLSIFRRRGHWALRDVTLGVAAGESVGVIGANGSGKSTLLRLIAGFTPPTEGSVRVESDVATILSLGGDFQPLLTGADNALTAAMLVGLSRREARRRLPEIVAFAELEGDIDQPLRTYSDGMRVRLSFAVAVHVEPKVLLVDEVLAVGDLRFQRRCLDRIEAMRRTGVTIVVVTHDLDLVRRVTERAVWLDRGRARSIGPTSGVVDAYEHAMNEGLVMEPVGESGTLRVGTREAEIVAIRILDSRGRPTTQVPSGGSLAVELDVVSNVPIVDAIISVGAHRDGEAETCFECTTAHGPGLGRLDGSATVRLEIQRLDLASGNYWLDVGLYQHDFERPFDYIWEAAPLTLPGRSGRGILQPPHRWERAESADAGLDR